MGMAVAVLRLLAAAMCPKERLKMSEVNIIGACRGMSWCVYVYVFVRVYSVIDCTYMII